jgi:hypothetical protein
MQARKLEEQTTRYYATIFDHGRKGEYGIDPIEWFTLFSQRIKLLEKTVEIYRHESGRALQAYMQQRTLVMGISLALVLLALILLAVGAQTARDIGANIRGLERTLQDAAESFDSGGEEY